MVADLQDSGAHVRTSFEKISLRLLLHVAGEEEARLTKLDAQHQTAVIAVGIRPDRAYTGDGCIADVPAVARLRDFDLPSLLLRVFDHVGKDLGRMFGHGGIDMLRRVFGQYTGKAAAVILVRVRIDHVRGTAPRRRFRRQ